MCNTDNDMFSTLENLKLESVIKISASCKRSEDTINKNIPTGEIEVLSGQIEILMNRTIPFQVIWMMILLRNAT